MLNCHYLSRPSCLALATLVLLVSCSVAAVACGGKTGVGEDIGEGVGGGIDEELQEPQAAHIMEHIRALSQDIGPRPAGSEQEAEAAQYAVAQFQSYGYDVEVQPVTAFVYSYAPANIQVSSPDSLSFQGVASRGRDPIAVTARLFEAPTETPWDIAPEEASGVIAVAERPPGGLEDLAQEAEAAGVAGLVVVNQAPELFEPDVDSSTQIPVIAVSSTDGERLLELAAQGSTEVTLSVHLGRTESANVVARPASGECETVSGAHYDTVAVSPGANDNASGASVVLELARELAGSSGHCFVLFGAEETGFDGSQTFVSVFTFPLTSVVPPHAMLNFDFVGGPGDLHLVGSPALVDLAREVAADLDIHIAEEDVRRGFRSDHLSFLDAGVPAIWFTTPPYDFIDSSQDTLDHVQPEVLEDVFSVALLFLRQFGGD